MTRKVTTEAGRRRLEATLRSAEERYAEIVASNPEAAEGGDTSVWHDNFAYEENQRQMHQWARRVRDLRAQLAALDVVRPARQPERVAVGCTVLVEDGATGVVRRYAVAGFDDGDPAAGRVSYTAPLGRALLGARVGDVRTVRAGGSERELTVVAVTATEEE